MDTHESYTESESLEFPEEVDAATAYSIEQMTVAYHMAIEKDWQGFKEFYDNHPDALFAPLTVLGDNAFHFAAGSKNPKLLKDLLGMVPDCRRFEALMRKDDHGNTAVHEVAITNCVEAAELVLEILFRCGNENEKKLLILNKLKETPLYRAVALGKTKMVQYLVKQIDANVLHEHFNRFDDISILHIAVIAQHFETALWLLKMEKELARRGEFYREKVEKLAKREEKNGMTCLNLLALMPSAFGSARSTSKLAMFVDMCLPKLVVDDDEGQKAAAAKLPLSQGQDLEKGKNKNDNISNKRAISKMRIAMWMWLIEVCPKIKKIWKEKRQYESALKLVELLVEQDTSWKESYKADSDGSVSLGLGKGEGKINKPGDIGGQKAAGRGENKSVSSLTEASNGKKKRRPIEAPLVMAASNGITEILGAILRIYPQAVSYVSNDGQNVLHAAIMFRQKEIFESILRLDKKILHKLADRIDHNGNTVLHHAADMQYYRGGTRPGPALQFQEELEWFENVKAIMPRQYIMHRNNNNITAVDLFEEKHAKQLETAQQWMKDTAQSCSTVSILVATVVFAAAYTVPGGNNDQGVPIFLHSPLFWVFTVMDVVSLISSLCSVVMFLSILTSPFKPEAFLKSLPKKLTIGFSLLFFSVLSSMITFTAALLLLIRLKRRWTATLVYVSAFIPVVLFALMEFPMYYAFLAGLVNLYNQFKRTPTRKKQKYLGSKK